MMKSFRGESCIQQILEVIIGMAISFLANRAFLTESSERFWPNHKFFSIMLADKGGFVFMTPFFLNFHASTFRKIM